MRALILVSLMLPTSVLAETFDPVNVMEVCRLVEKRAENLLDYRWGDDYQLENTIAATKGDPLFVNMALDADSAPDERDAVYQKDFVKKWRNECIRGLAVN